MQFAGTLILLYFKEILPRTVSVSTLKLVQLIKCKIYKNNLSNTVIIATI